jgi:hypothetical protein
MSKNPPESAIRDAWIAGLIATGANILLTLIYSTGGGLSRLDPWNIADLIILPLLTWGIYRRNSLAALIMPVYYLISSIPNWFNDDGLILIGVPVTLLFVWIFWRGYRAIGAQITEVR